MIGACHANTTCARANVELSWARLSGGTPRAGCGGDLSRVRRRGGLAALCTVAALMGARSALAAPPFEAELFEGCPRAESFLDEVRAKTGAAELPPMRLVVTRSAAGASGSLWMGEPGGERLQRTIEAGSCGVVLKALAFSAALAIGTEQAPRAEASASQGGPSVPGAPPAAAEDDRAHPAAPGHERHATLGASLAGVAMGRAGWLASPSLFVEFARGPQAGFSPSLRLSAARAAASIDAGPGAATLRWTTGALDACPVRYAARWLSSGLRPCARLTAGVIDADGVGVEQPSSATRPWAAAGALLRAESQPVAPLVLSVEAGLDAPLTRDRFVFTPSTSIFRAPGLLPSLSIGAGLRWP
jgi:hypothetical protein